MSLSISIRFLTGRAHLHPWNTHHSEGQVEWPPSPWRLLRALVAVAGRGLTTLPWPDDVSDKLETPIVPLAGHTSIKKRGVPQSARSKLSLSTKKETLALKEPLTDEEAQAFKDANDSTAFSEAIDALRALAAQAIAVAMRDTAGDAVPLSRLANLLSSLSPVPEIWLPTSGTGHTRQYFPIHVAGIVKPSGSAVFDTFATVSKDRPAVFHWPTLELSEESPELADLRLLLGRMTYFGRAESWVIAKVDTTPLDTIDGVEVEKSHWRCVCIEDGPRPTGEEYGDYTLQRRLAPLPVQSSNGERNLPEEAAELLPLTNDVASGKTRKNRDALKSELADERTNRPHLLLLRCLLRESGQDMRDNLERPIGTRWIHYAVPRDIRILPPARRQQSKRTHPSVHIVRYTITTASTHRPVRPPLTDTLLVADKFRRAALAVHSRFQRRANYGGSDRHPRNLCGRDETGEIIKGHDHAFFWPTDEDNDGFLDHVTIYCRAGFEPHEVAAMRQLTRLKQRGGRPDLLITPTFVGDVCDFEPWKGRSTTESGCFVSATPYFCPVHLSHGRSGGRSRRISGEIVKGMIQQGLIHSKHDAEIDELAFDYDAEQFVQLRAEIESGTVSEPVAPRQYFPVTDPPDDFPPLSRLNGEGDCRYPHAVVKDPDVRFPFGLSVGLFVDRQTRFIRALSFNRRRRNAEVKGFGRMFRITFTEAPPTSPFAIGDQCHFGLGLFVPAFGEVG